jgi:hypothetical protein
MVRGNGQAQNPDGDNTYDVWFDRRLDGCVPTATLAANAGGGSSPPPPGRITVAFNPADTNKIIVSTFGVSGAAEPLPFNLILAC